MQVQFFTLAKPACLQKYFHGRVLSIRVFSSDGDYLNNSLHLARKYDEYPSIFSCQVETIASRDQFKPIRIGEDLVVNYNL